jgi:hypothetical protein
MRGVQWHGFSISEATAAARPQNISGALREVRREGACTQGPEGGPGRLGGRATTVVWINQPLSPSESAPHGVGQAKKPSGKIAGRGGFMLVEGRSREQRATDRGLRQPVTRAMCWMANHAEALPVSNRRCPFGSRVAAKPNGRQDVLRGAAGLSRWSGLPTTQLSCAGSGAAAAAGGAVLDDPRLRAGRCNPDAEPGKVVVPLDEGQLPLLQPLTKVFVSRAIVAP